MKNTKVILLSERLYSDVLILPSYFEGLPSALLEVMSYGQVPVVTPVSSIQDVILNKKKGIIIPIKNSTRIIDELNKIYNDLIIK